MAAESDFDVAEYISQENMHRRNLTTFESTQNMQHLKSKIACMEERRKKNMLITNLRH